VVAEAQSAGLIDDTIGPGHLMFLIVALSSHWSAQRIGDVPPIRGGVWFELVLWIKPCPFGARRILCTAPGGG
jgi:hypothetical protein